jgi:hypothetical protein
MEKLMNGVSRTLLAAAVLVPVAGMAQERPQQSQFSYNYVELSYDETDFELPGGDADGDGLTLSGSFEITDDWHAYASYGSHDLDFGIDSDTWMLGAGYSYPIRSGVDLYGRVLYIDSSLDAGPVNVDDDGLGLQFRVRGSVNDALELEGGVQYVDVGDSDTSLTAGARYNFNSAFSAGLVLTFGGDTDGIGINARYSF